MIVLAAYYLTKNIGITALSSEGIYNNIPLLIIEVIGSSLIASVWLCAFASWSIVAVLFLVILIPALLGLWGAVDSKKQKINQGKLDKIREEMKVEKKSGQTHYELLYAVNISHMIREILKVPDSEGLNKEYAVQLVVLQDTLEKTETSFSELEETFGIDVANGVLALTKNKELPNDEQMRDSLNRIKKMPIEVSAVKLAEWIANLQKLLAHWDDKKKYHLDESRLILTELEGGSKFLADRLKSKIRDYTDALLESIGSEKVQKTGAFLMPISKELAEKMKGNQKDPDKGELA